MKRLHVATMALWLCVSACDVAFDAEVAAPNDLGSNDAGRRASVPPPADLADVADLAVEPPTTTDLATATDAAAPPPVDAPCPVLFEPSDRASLPRAVEAFLCTRFSATTVPGAVAAYVQDGAVVWSRAFGNADLALKMAMTTDQVFQAASLSKTLTAWGAMKLVETGRLDLDAPIETYLTRWHLPPSQFHNQRVTARRILSHTAGLNIQGYAGYPPNGPLPTLEQSLSGNGGDVGPLLVVAEPGSTYAYSGGGVTLLQLAIEEITQRPFAAYMNDEVLIPLGMTSSAFEWKAPLRPRTPIAYDSTRARLPNYLFREQAAAGLYTTAGDLARLLAAYQPGPRGEPIGRGVISPGSIATMTTPMPGGPWATGGSAQPGLGCFVWPQPDGTSVLLHEGSNRGWRAQYVLHASKRDGWVVLTNSDSGADLFNPLVAQWLTWMASL
jgi:CubicO group peptidase (beta-lactamase class C family)